MKFPKRRKFWKHTLVFLFTRSEIFRFVSRRIEILLFLFHLLVKNRSFHFLRINLDLNERVLRLNCKKIQFNRAIFLEKRTKRGKIQEKHLYNRMNLNELNKLDEPETELLPPPLAFVSSHNFGRKNQHGESRNEKKGQSVGSRPVYARWRFLLSSSSFPFSPPASRPLTSARKSSRRTHLDLLAAAQTSAMKYLARLTLIFRRVTETTWKRSMHARAKPRISRHYIPP